MRIKSYQKYKPSGVEWLGDVPEHWSALPLRRVIKTVKTGGTPTGAEDSAFDDNGFNWFSPSDFSESVVLSKSNRALSEEGKREVRLFPPMTVMLVGIGATIGKVGLSMDESSCNQQINGIVCSDRLDPLFTTYYMKTMREFIVKCGKYTTLPIINQEETKNLILTIPPVPEQQAIAAFLDRETGKIDSLIERKEKLIELLKEKRTALISKAVTKGLNSNAKLKPSGVEWLGDTPEHWNKASLKWISIRYSGGTPDKTIQEYWEDGSIPWLNSGSVNDSYITRPSEYITEEAYKNSSAKWIPKGALVIALAGQGKTKGMVAQLGFRTTCNQSMAAIIPDNRVNARMLYWWITKNYSNLRNLAGGDARDGLNLEMIGSIPIPIPPLSEQQAIADFLDRETGKIDSLVSKVETAIEKLKEYRTSLISSAVTGKIDLR